MASFSMVRAGLLGISVMALSGCGEDPQLSTLQQRLLDVKKKLAQSTADQTQASATSNALQAELSTFKAAQSAADESMRDELKLVREALGATRGQLAAAHRQVATSTSAMDAAKQDMATLQAAVNKATVRAEALAGHLGLDGTEEITLADLMLRLSEAYGTAMQGAQTAAQQERATIKTLTAYNKRLKAADAIHRQLSLQLHQVTQLRDALRGGWQAERARAADASRMLELQVENLRSQLATQDQTKGSLAARADLLEVQRDDNATKLASKITELKASLAQLPPLEAALASATDTNEKLQATHDVQLRELQRMSEAEDFLYQLFERKSLDLRDKAKSLKTAESESVELAATLADESAEHDALKTEHQAVVAEREALQAEVAALEYEITELTSALTTEEMAYDKIKGRAHQASANAANLAQQLAHAREQATKQIEFVTPEVHAGLTQRKSTTATAAPAVDTRALAASQARATKAEALLAPIIAQRDSLLSMLTTANARLAELESRLKP